MIYFNYIEKNSVHNNCKKLVLSIDSFIKNVFFQKWVGILSRELEIPRDILNEHIKQKIFHSYNFETRSFLKKIRNSSFLLNNIFFLFYSIFIVIFSKKKTQSTNYDLLIAEPVDQENLDLYKKLINKYKAKRVCVLTKNKNFKLNRCKNIFFQNFKNYDIRKNTSFFLIKLFFLNFYFFYKYRCNYSYLSYSILNEYFFFNSFYQKYSFKNVISHLHYKSSLLHNFILKKNNKKSKFNLIMKNIPAIAPMNFFCTADRIFTFSKKTYFKKNVFHKIQKQIAVGSFFMERKYYSSIKKKHQKIDILCIGGNGLYPGGPWDLYKEYSKNYTDHLNWIKKISQKYPYLKVAFKHRNNNSNKFEENFFKKTNVRFIKKNINSYSSAINARYICSYCSTMIIEMNSIGKNAFFLDPGKKNNIFLNGISSVNKIRIASFQKFEKSIFSSFSKKQKIKSQLFCLDSRNVSNKIFKEIAHD